MRVVDSDWVAARLEELRVIDVRDAWEYDGIGHLPGAVNVPFDAFRAERHAAAGGEGEAGMLPGAERFGALLGDAGVSRDDVVAYDDTHGVFALGTATTGSNAAPSSPNRRPTRRRSIRRAP